MLSLEYISKYKRVPQGLGWKVPGSWGKGENKDHSFQSQGRQISPSLRTEKYFVTCSLRLSMVTPSESGFLVSRMQQLIICSVVIVISFERLESPNSSRHFWHISSSAFESLKWSKRTVRLRVKSEREQICIKVSMFDAGRFAVKLFHFFSPCTRLYSVYYSYTPTIYIITHPVCVRLIRSYDFRRGILTRQTILHVCF